MLSKLASRIFSLPRSLFDKRIGNILRITKDRKVFIATSREKVILLGLVNETACAPADNSCAMMGISFIGPFKDLRPLLSNCLTTAPLWSWHLYKMKKKLNVGVITSRLDQIFWGSIRHHRCSPASYCPIAQRCHVEFFPSNHAFCVIRTQQDSNKQLESRLMLAGWL